MHYRGTDQTPMGIQRPFCAMPEVDGLVRGIKFSSLRGTAS